MQKKHARLQGTRRFLPARSKLLHSLPQFQTIYTGSPSNVPGGRDDTANSGLLDMELLGITW